MQTILYLEDRPEQLDSKADILKNTGFNVIKCSRIDLAKKQYAKHKDEIVCIITDLNMNPEWLESHESESEGGVIAGWIWLWYFVYNRGEKIVPTIIFSGFIEELIERLENPNNVAEHTVFSDERIAFIKKGDITSSTKKTLIDMVNKVVSANESSRDKELDI